MKKELIPVSRIAQSIHVLRGQKVILDSELAQLYGVAAKVLNQAVKRNRERFPDDFMFRLTPSETSDLNWSQSVTSSRKHRGKVYRPYAFTEQEVAVRSTVLKKDPAWVAHASRVLVSASRRNNLPLGRRPVFNDSQSPRWRDASANARDARATQK
jgi:hypothetical protein